MQQPAYECDRERALILYTWETYVNLITPSTPLRKAQLTHSIQHVSHNITADVSFTTNMPLRESVGRSVDRCLA